MKSDEIHPAVQSFQQLHNLVGMSRRVVYPAKDDILERQTPLMGKVIVAQQFHHLTDVHGALCRHEAFTQRMVRSMKADGDMAFALLDEALQLSTQSHRTDGDALRAPCPAVVGRQEFRCPQHVVKVVHRLALSHEDDVRQAVMLRQGIHLVQNVSSRQVALPSLLARLTEQAIHLASHLTRHTQRGPLTVRDIDRLHEESFILSALIATIDREEIFNRSVGASLTIYGSHAAYLTMSGQQFPVFLGDICHLLYVRHMAVIKPPGYLASGKGRHSQGLSERLQLVEGLSEEYFFHFCLFDFDVQRYEKTSGEPNIFGLFR